MVSCMAARRCKQPPRKSASLRGNRINASLIPLQRWPGAEALPVRHSSPEGLLHLRLCEISLEIGHLVETSDAPDR